MAFSEDLKTAINHCLNNSIPFVLYRAPLGDTVFLADNRENQPKSDLKYIINLWNSPDCENIVIRDCLTINDVLSTSNHVNNTTLPPSTDKDHYIESVTKLINKLKVRDGKTVISRVYRNISNNLNWAEIAERLFDNFINTFCHIYYTPETGAWLGATPEVLLKSTDRKEFTTMALAGTHPIGQEWDNKNRREQQMVVDFIETGLMRKCDNLCISPVRTLQYGNIEHLCTNITGVLKPEYCIYDVVNTLSPTPAVAGLPRNIAIDEINVIEKHCRSCYSGYIAVEDEKSFIAYVNLRCMQFNIDGSFCVYAGGGITAESDAETEWEETSSKISALISTLKL